MDFKLEQFLTDICTGSVLTYQQAEQLWMILANKRKMWQAAEDANSMNFEEAYRFATMGHYNDSVSPKIFRELVCIENENPQEMTKIINALPGNKFIKGKSVKGIESVSVTNDNGHYKAFVLIVAELTG